jgi:hypothetical protein
MSPCTSATANCRKVKIPALKTEDGAPRFILGVSVRATRRGRGAGIRKRPVIQSSFRTSSRISLEL